MKITDFDKRFKDYFPVGEGWRQIVTPLVRKLIKIDPNIEITQIKEKFGGLRFYCCPETDEVSKLIEKAEKESFKTCEDCGTKKNVTTKGGWILTLCDKCRGGK